MHSIRLYEPSSLFQNGVYTTAIIVIHYRILEYFFRKYGQGQLPITIPSIVMEYERPHEVCVCVGGGGGSCPQNLLRDKISNFPKYSVIIL